MPLQPRSWPPEGPWSALDPSPEAPPALWLIDRRQDGLSGRRPTLLGLLSAEEQARLERLRRADDRDRFLLGRGVLRLLLGTLCGEDPAGLELATGPYGKPRLADRDGARLPIKPPEFNIAHSGDLVLLGFHASRPVGVDVEWHRPGLAWAPIARRCLAPDLCESIEAQPAAARLPVFLRHWCRLEAQLKARGTGFGASLEPNPSSSAEVVLHDLELPQGYSGAAALV
ncbi:4'-phosphopantetheinyl transferase superfamily protein [Synechococcus sp. Tobar12-5m-g]|uniref:4'-phosphopantetheinyl transferase family protein n=1 Tax=unclassified Synechococcus TaxID=2626047 RepID=UPI0020CD091D|nr:MULTISPECIES: 4'-phosphopantetheinyl transferase superfamily protein [unclassified Synechococcus]MCP9772304.1 4'-phosphopantetheinyl transferase superfamily protein [Synechococcus sp. Tobar12-5m-g]MCP9873246.1 4'-phosphopantetheinyl transferase superfamily protein [Synechococcus sp. Cruz CV-v-12]